MEKNILIVEDSLTQATVLEYILKKNNYNVTIASNGQNAIDWLNTNHPALIISDIVMPNMNGFEFCRQLKSNEATNHIPVILLTSLTDSSEIIEGLACGADSFVTKPYNESFLLSMIEKLLKNENSHFTNPELSGLEISFEGSQRLIQANNMQVNKLLVSVYEGAILQNIELKKVQENLRLMNDNLEQIVAERTAELTAEIEERKKIENDLKASELEFRTLAESMPQIVWSTRADGWNIYFNRQWTDYTGLTLEESYGHGWNKPFHPDDQKRAWDAWDNAVNNNGIYSIEVRLRRFDGEYFWWLVRGVPSINEKGEIVKWFGTCTYIEEIKKAEIALKEREEELKTSEDILKKFATHLQNKQEEDKVLLATQLDNELGQNLVALKMDIGLLKKKVLNGNNNKESEEIFNKLDQTYNSIGKSINTTLKFMDNLRYEVLYLMGFLEAVKLYSSEFQLKNKINCVFEGSISKLYLDQNQATSLFRIFQNAMLNIAQHSKATKVKICLNINDNMLIMEIWDNGIGFDPDKIKNEDSTGLVFMKERAMLLDGDIFITSYLKKGTSILVKIPYSR